MKITRKRFQALLHEEVARARKILRESNTRVDFPQRVWPEVVDASNTTGPGGGLGKYKEPIPTGVGVVEAEYDNAYDDDGDYLQSDDAQWYDSESAQGLDIDQDLAGAGSIGTPDELFSPLDERKSIKTTLNALKCIINEEIERARQVLKEGGHGTTAQDRFHMPMSGISRSATRSYSASDKDRPSSQIWAEEQSPFDDETLWSDDDTNDDVTLQSEPVEVPYQDRFEDDGSETAPQAWEAEDDAYYGEQDMRRRHAANDPSYSVGTPEELFPELGDDL